MRKKNFILILLILLTFSSSTSTLFAEGFNENGAYTLGLNVFHTNNSKGSSVFPLKEKWITNVGITHGQPLVVDETVYILTNSKLVAVNMDSGEIVSELLVSNSNINATPYIERVSEGKYNIYVPLIKGVTKIQANKYSDDSISLKQEWTNENNIIANSLSMLNDSNERLNSKYLVVPSQNSKIYVLNCDDGSTVINGVINSEGTLGMGLPYGDYTSLIISANNETVDKGYFASVSVLNGVLQLSYLHNDKMKFNIEVAGLTDVVSYSKFKDINTDRVTDLIFAVEKSGSIIGYEPFKDEVLFKIDKYDGIGDVAGLAVVDKYLLVTYNTGKLVCIDYERAIYDGQYHPDKLVETIIFESNLSQNTFSNPLIVRDSAGNNVLIAASKGGDMRAYKLDRYNPNNTPIEIENAFIKEGRTVSGININSGIISKLTYSNNQLLFIDGGGNLHSYFGEVINNLSIVDFKNSKDGGLEKGKSYKATLEILNSTNKIIKNATLELIVNKNNSFKNKVDIPSDGLKVELEYTVPLDFEGDILSLVAKVNMEENILEEVTYEDNIAELLLGVVGNLDLEVVDIRYNEYPIGRWAYAIVKVRNNSKQVIKDIPVKVTIAGNSKIEKRTLAPNMEINVLYLFKTPSSAKEFTIIGHINHSRIYKETNYENNMMSINARTKNNTSLDSIVNGSKGDSSHWDEERVDSSGNTVKKDYWANIDLNANVSSDKIPSGNGFGLLVNSTVKTNYDKPNLVTGAQVGYAEFLGKRYDMIGGGIDKDQSFILKENSDSILYDSVETRHLTRKIYVPVSLPDGVYQVKIVVEDAITPGAVMRKEITIPIEIKKSMYDYDYTKPGK